MTFFIFTTAAATAASATDIAAVDSGGYAHFALASDGTVWAWGNNMYGQMGDAAKERIEVPFKVPGLSGVKAISSDGSHTVVLKDDGSVWACGKNEYGQLGDGTQTARAGFVQCKGLSGIIAISANDNMALALKNDGTVWVWGKYATTGVWSDLRNVTTPEQVSGLTNIRSISDGSGHYLAVDASGDVWGWGNNLNGQLGMSKSPQYPPAKLGITGVKQAVAGYQYSMFLKNDGTVWGMGWNNGGVLGTGGSSSGSKTPVQVPGLSGIVQIAGTTEGVTALKDDGTIYIWGTKCAGAGLIGQTGTAINTPTALPVPATTKAIGVSTGSPLLALQQNGTVFGTGGTLFYTDPETGISVNSSKWNQIKFVAGSLATPTAAPGGATAQPTAAPTQAPSGSGSKTPAPSALVVIGILSAVAIFAMRKK